MNKLGKISIVAALTFGLALCTTTPAFADDTAVQRINLNLRDTTSIREEIANVCDAHTVNDGSMTDESFDAFRAACDAAIARVNDINATQETFDILKNNIELTLNSLTPNPVSQDNGDENTSPNAPNTGNKNTSPSAPNTGLAGVLNTKFDIAGKEIRTWEIGSAGLMVILLSVCAILLVDRYFRRNHTGSKKKAKMSKRKAKTSKLRKYYKYKQKIESAKNDEKTEVVEIDKLIRNHKIKKFVTAATPTFAIAMVASAAVYILSPSWATPCSDLCFMMNLSPITYTIDKYDGGSVLNRDVTIDVDNTNLNKYVVVAKNNTQDSNLVINSENIGSTDTDIIDSTSQIDPTESFTLSLEFNYTGDISAIDNGVIDDFAEIDFSVEARNTVVFPVALVKSPDLVNAAVLYSDGTAFISSDSGVTFDQKYSVNFGDVSNKYFNPNGGILYNLNSANGVPRYNGETSIYVGFIDIDPGRNAAPTSISRASNYRAVLAPCCSYNTYLAYGNYMLDSAWTNSSYRVGDWSTSAAISEDGSIAVNTYNYAPNNEYQYRYSTNGGVSYASVNVPAPGTGGRPNIKNVTALSPTGKKALTYNWSSSSSSYFKYGVIDRPDQGNTQQITDIRNFDRTAGRLLYIWDDGTVVGTQNGKLVSSSDYGATWNIDPKTPCSGWAVSPLSTCSQSGGVRAIDADSAEGVSLIGVNNGSIMYKDVYYFDATSQSWKPSHINRSI